MNSYNNFKNSVVRILERIVIVFVALAICASILQVIFRYILNNSLYWSEELTRYSIIWMVFIAAPVAYIKGMHMNVDIIFTRLPHKLKTFTASFINLVILFFAAVLFIYGIKLTGKTLLTLSPSIKIPMGFIYLSIPLGSTFISWFALDEFIRNIYSFVKLPYMKKEGLN